MDTNQSLELLVGLAVTYLGDMANPAGRGAIVAARIGQTGLEFDVTLSDGREFPRMHPCQVAGMDQLQAASSARLMVGGSSRRFAIEADRLPPEEVAELRAAAAMRKAQQAAAKDEAARRFADEVSRLKAEHPTLQQGDDRKTAAANIRAMLRAAFPGVRFGVTLARGSMVYSIDVRWTDGPTAKEVEAITGRFVHGSFDGMTDCYNHRSTPWSKTFGGADYVHTSRDHTDALVHLAIAAAVAEFGNKDAPTVEDFRAGRAHGTTPLSSDSDRYGHWCWSSIVHRQLTELSATETITA